MPDHDCAPGHRTSHFSESHSSIMCSSFRTECSGRRNLLSISASPPTDTCLHPNPQPPLSRCTQAQTPPAPNLQSLSPSYCSPTSSPTASAAHHSRLHSSHSSAKPSSPVSPFASSLAQSERSENVCKTISVFQSPHQSPWRLGHVKYLAVHAIPASKIQKSP